MPKFLALAFGFGLMLCIVTCNDYESPHNEGQKKLTYSEFLSYVYQEPGENGKWIVDGDTPISSEKLLWEFYEKNFMQESNSIIDLIKFLIVGHENGADVVWTTTQKKNITYCVSKSSFSSRYSSVVQAMDEATGAWEGVADINFDHVVAQDDNCTASNANVVFDVRQTSGGGYLARAFFPDDIRANRNILIDTSSFNSTNPTLAGILRHELGHTIGLRHEHTRPEAGTCFEDNNWRVLTPYDSSSVMHYPQCNGTGDWSLTLTQKDIQGIQALYGAPDGQPDPDPDPVDGTPVTEKTETITLAKGAQNMYGPYAVVPGTSFKAVISGTGDADLYTKAGSAPTKSSYDCRPYKNGSEETCEVASVPESVSRMYVMVDGYSASTYVLTVTYTKPADGDGSPAPKEVVQNIETKSIGKGEFQALPAITVAPGTQFTVEMTGTGDADLYVKMGSVAPTLSSYTCRPYLGTSTETCTNDVPANINAVSIGVNGYTASTYSLKITYYILQ